jgi:hypothetical protein
VEAGNYFSEDEVTYDQRAVVMFGVLGVAIASVFIFIWAWFYLWKPPNLVETIVTEGLGSDQGTIPACFTREGPPPCWWDKTVRGGGDSYVLIGERLLYLDTPVGSQAGGW